MSRKNLVLGIILVALIVVVYLYQGPGQNREENNNFLTDLKVDQVDKMEIIRKGTSTVLTKEGENKWKVEGEGDFYVQESVAKEFISKMDNLTQTDFELRSTNKDKKSEFRTNEENGSVVKMYDQGEQVADFIVGSLDPSTFNNTYISRPDSAETYAAQGVEMSSFILREDWRSKVIFDTSKDKLSKLRFQYPDREFTVEKQQGEEGTQWQGTVPREFPVSEDKIQKVADVMTDLEAAKIPEQTFEGTGLSKHLIIVEATGDGMENTLMVGEKDGEQGDRTLYYAKKASSDNVYLITEEQRNTLKQTIEGLK